MKVARLRHCPTSHHLSPKSLGGILSASSTSAQLPTLSFVPPRRTPTQAGRRQHYLPRAYSPHRARQKCLCGPCSYGRSAHRRIRSACTAPVPCLAACPLWMGLSVTSFGGASGGRVVEISGASASGRQYVHDTGRGIPRFVIITGTCIAHHPASPRKLHPTNDALWLGTRRGTSLQRVSPRSHRVGVTKQFRSNSL